MSIKAVITSLCNLAVVAGMFYLFFFRLRTETGFFSFHPVKRIAIVMFLPFVLLYLLSCLDWDDD